MSDPRETLIDLWTEDADFRERFRQDPAGAVASTGLSLDPADLEALASLEPGLSEEALQRRLNRGTQSSTGNC